MCSLYTIRSFFRTVHRLTGKRIDHHLRFIDGYAVEPQVEQLNNSRSYQSHRGGFRFRDTEKCARVPAWKKLVRRFRGGGGQKRTTQNARGGKCLCFDAKLSVRRPTWQICRPSHRRSSDRKNRYTIRSFPLVSSGCSGWGQTNISGTCLPVS